MKDTRQAAWLSQISEKTTPSRLMGPTFLSFTVKQNSDFPVTPRSVYPVGEHRLGGVALKETILREAVRDNSLECESDIWKQI